MEKLDDAVPESARSAEETVFSDVSEESVILSNTNALLRAVGIDTKPMSAFEELRKSASSMFVAIFEAMFNRTLAGVERQPTHTGDYVLNAQHVIDALAGSILHMPLAHITGESIVRGESAAIINLIDIFMLISDEWNRRRARASRGGGKERVRRGSGGGFPAYVRARARRSRAGGVKS